MDVFPTFKVFIVLHSARSLLILILQYWHIQCLLLMMTFSHVLRCWYTVNIIKYLPAWLIKTRWDTQYLQTVLSILDICKDDIQTYKYFLHKYPQLSWMIIGNLQQQILCHVSIDRKSHHDSFALVIPLWKNSFVVVVYYELSFQVHDVTRRYKCIINVQMLKLCTNDQIDMRPLANARMFPSKGRYPLHYSLPLESFQCSYLPSNSNMHSLEAARQKKGYK